MTRLLLPLLAALALQTPVNAFPFGKNLEFKNDIGTKTLIKGDAVYSDNLVIEDLKKTIKKIQDEAFELYWDELSYEKIKKESDIKLRNDYSSGYGILRHTKNAEESYKKWDNRAAEHDIEIEKIEKNYDKKNNKIKEDLNKLNEEQSIKIHAVNLSFNPILIDLNNIKKIQSQVNLTCFNPQLNQELKEIWLNYYPYEGGKNQRELAICKKYAKFKN